MQLPATIESAKTHLGRAFRVLCLEWAAAAPDAAAAAPVELRARVERLTSLGVDVALVAAGGIDAVDPRLCARPDVEGRLFLLLSDGAEAYVLGPTGPRLIDRRLTTPDEDAQLTGAVETVRDELGAKGLTSRVVGRDNKRHGLVLGRAAPADDFEERLVGAGIAGLPGLVELATSLAHGAGVPRPCVSFRDGRLDFALTDFADSMRWLLQWIVRYRDYDAREVLVVGDDFGPNGGAGGAARRLMIPELHGAAFASVGAGHDGAARSVQRVGGGHGAVLELLDEQIALREARVLESFPSPSTDRDWLFQVEGFDPFREREVETWLTVANGETGTRGSLEEGSPASTPATFVAGVFGDDTGELHIRQPVMAPDWLCVRLLVEGMPLTLTNGEIVEHRRVLDMSQGIVFRYWRQRDRVGRTVRVRTARFASLSDRSIMVLRAEASPEDFCGRLVWEACVGVSHAGGPVYDASLTALSGSGFVARTKGRKGGGHVLAVSTRPASGSPVARYLEQSRDVIGGRLDCNEPATIDRIAAVVSSPSRPPASTVALNVLERAEAAGFDELLRRHVAAWRERWDDAAVSIGGDAHAELALRFSMYHMMSTAHPTKESVSVGARGLSGMSYFNHVFWDTEIFVVPFFIYTHPQTARTLLSYRFRNLDGARRKARDMGFKGALFPWESADKGIETTPPYGIGPHGEMIPILSGLLEHHISADVGWAVWEYWKATGDDEFMESMGTELLLETARFWASRASRDELGSFHISMVVGPDEYHEGVDDNAYTNVLARYNIERALDAFPWLTERAPDRAAALGERIGLTTVELAHWRNVADALVDGFDPRTKLYEQFAGFYEMDDVDPAALAARPMAADLLLGREVTLKAKVVKQADVVMLCYVLSNEIPADAALANLRYYEPITSHGSSLSPGIHAALAARLGDIKLAAEAFHMASDIDLSDNMGNAARGLHMATMGGLWQAAVMGFGGVRRDDETLVIDPHLPDDWSSFSYTVRFRGSRFKVAVGGGELHITVDDAAATVVVGRRRQHLALGVHDFHKGSRGWEERP
jgi:trehalose/maltose hydrolase-like predicted phosphorylase